MPHPSLEQLQQQYEDVMKLIAIGVNYELMHAQLRTIKSRCGRRPLRSASKGRKFEEIQ